MKPLIEAALGKKPQRRPVWFLRQAGRYLPEYRELRAKYSFLDVCKNPQLATEITLQPLRRFDLDGAIIFSDILIPCTAMGQTLTFDKGHGPQLDQPIRGKDQLRGLHKPNAEKDLGYVGDAISLTKSKLAPGQTMIGFAGAPFTVASYMIEGAGSKEFTEVKRLMFREPEVFNGLLDLLKETTIDYLKMQVKAGADIVMLFDTWLGNLCAPDFVSHVAPVMKSLFQSLSTLGVPVIYYPGQGLDKMFEISEFKVNVIAVDWRTRLSNASAILQKNGMTPTLQGNIDPQTFLGSEELVRARTRSIIKEMDQLPNAHIFNVGHGLLPHIPIEALKWCIDEVRR